jgi:excisionase family DNA binding protein
MENLQITFETLPKAFAYLIDEVKELKKLVLQNTPDLQFLENDHWFDLTELCNYHPDKPKPATVYGWVFAGTIPVHKGGKKLRFLKSEIDEWLKTGRKATVEETALRAEQYFKNK